MVEKPGLLLELFSRIAAEEIGRFSDVRHGVRMNWDGKLNENGTVSGTNNEVDLILVDGFTVYCVSCKSGYFDKVALYELETVASQFDIGNVRKVLICDYIDESTKERAQNMRILVISGITGYSTFEQVEKNCRRWLDRIYAVLLIACTNGKRLIITYGKLPRTTKRLKMPLSSYRERQKG